MFTASKIMDAFEKGKNIISLGHPFSALERITKNAGGIIIYYGHDYTAVEFLNMLNNAQINHVEVSKYELEHRKEEIVKRLEAQILILWKMGSI